MKLHWKILKRMWWISRFALLNFMLHTMCPPDIMNIMTPTQRLLTRRSLFAVTSLLYSLLSCWLSWSLETCSDLFHIHILFYIIPYSLHRSRTSTLLHYMQRIWHTYQISTFIHMNCSDSFVEMGKDEWKGCSNFNLIIHLKVRNNNTLCGCCSAQLRKFGKSFLWSLVTLCSVCSSMTVFNDF